MISDIIRKVIIIYEIKINLQILLEQQLKFKNA
jgi:hypothetical protein